MLAYREERLQQHAHRSQCQPLQVLRLVNQRFALLLETGGQVAERIVEEMRRWQARSFCVRVQLLRARKNALRHVGEVAHDD